MSKDKVINDIRVLVRWIGNKPAETFDDVQEIGNGKLNYSLDEMLLETLKYLQEDDNPKFLRDTPLTDEQVKVVRSTGHSLCFRRRRSDG